MKNTKFYFVSLLLILSVSLFAENSVQMSSNGVAIQSASLNFQIDEQGYLSLWSQEGQKDYLSQDYQSPIATLYSGTRAYQPIKMEPGAGNLFYLIYSDNIKLGVSVNLFANHFTLTAANLDVPAEIDIDLLQWGPYYSYLMDRVGETVGVIYNDDFALGLQAVNIKTIGGWPGSIVDTRKKGSWQSTRFGAEFSAAWPMEKGSCLNAYVRDYSKYRKITQFGYTDFEVFPMVESDGKSDRLIVGSSIALFGVPTVDVLSVISEIELEHGLPHPMVDGEWNKLSSDAAYLYFITNSVNPLNVKKVAKAARRLGSDLIYSEYPFKTMGEFKFKAGADSRYSKKVIAPASDLGVNIGIHMISNFISRMDPYARGSENINDYICKIKSTALVEPLSSGSSDSIVLEDITDFNSQECFVFIDNEMIHCKPGDQNRMNILFRGVQNTAAESHPAGSRVWLVPYEWSCYHIVWGNIDLNKKISKRMASLFNETGIAQMSWDGLEGARKTGYGSYAENKIIQDWYDALDSTQMRCDGSRLNHYNWHAYTFVNWGETHMPFRINEPDFRYRTVTNYPYYVRNFFPRMFGWCAFYANTSVEEAHWLGSKVAAYNVGLAFRDLGVFANPAKNQIFDAVREWDTARTENAFSLAQRLRLASFDSEWELKMLEPGVKWLLINKITGNQEVVQAKGISNLVQSDEVKFSAFKQSSRSKEDLSLLTDNLLTPKSLCKLPAGVSHVVIDLGQIQSFDQIRIWRDFRKGPTYKDMLIETATNADFTENKIILFNNDSDNSLGKGMGTDLEYVEGWKGKRIEFPTQQARFIRIGSNGSNRSRKNYINEIQVLSGKRSIAKPIMMKPNTSSNENLALTGFPETSSSENAKAMIDANESTSLVLSRDKDCWAQVDVGIPVHFTQINIRWKNPPASFKIQSSSDGKQFFEVFQSRGTVSENMKINVQVFDRRYIRILLPQDKSAKDVEISELELFSSVLSDH